jgi:large subunit ribosomal protein L3
MVSVTKKGILGRKVRMTQIFSPDGMLLPVTVIEAGPCAVVEVKTKARDGYNALQLGVGKKKGKRTSKPVVGYFAKRSLEPAAWLKEIRVEDVGEAKVGDTVEAAIFAAGDRVDVTGVSKGRGFAGGIKRHGWRGGKATHGSMFHRAPGSIGASASPSRVFKGKTLPGHMGNRQVTVHNLQVVDVRGNHILVKGAVPGAPNTLVSIRSSVKAS